MKIIKFNGYGQPEDPAVCTGTIALLIEPEGVSIVRIELLAPDEYGPALEHALNEAELAKRATAALSSAFPNGLPQERHWVVSCPSDIAADAVFKTSLS